MELIQALRLLLVAAAAMVGLGRFELPTSRLSGGRSNQLSYRPALRIVIAAARGCTGVQIREASATDSGLRKRNSVRRRQRAIDRESPDLTSDRENPGFGLSRAKS